MLPKASWWELSDNEINQLTERLYLVEKNLLQAIADLRVHQAENFVTHKELGDYKKDHDIHFKEFKENVKFVIGKAVAVSSLVVTIIIFIANWFKGGV